VHERQPPLEGFKTPFETALVRTNRWVKLSECIPWDVVADSYLTREGFAHIEVDPTDWTEAGQK